MGIHPVKPGRQSASKLILTRLLPLFAFAALLLTLYASHFPIAAGADRPTPPDPNRPAAKDLPAPSTYIVDTDHSFAYFGARHHVVGLVRGRFDKVTGAINVAKDPADCSVDISIDVASISTQNTHRDDDLRSPVYFDAKQFPTMTYRGRGIRRVSPTTWAMDGSLTMHGVTRVVPLTFNFNGPFTDIKPGSPARVAFHASAGTRRAEYGMGARDNLDELGNLTTPDVAIDIDVEADQKLPPQ
jgi:polyisoprenoid-binding protein YceI